MRLPSAISAALHKAPHRLLKVKDLARYSRGFYNEDDTQRIHYWMGNLPERLMTMPPVPYDRHKGAPKTDASRIMLFGDFDPLTKTINLDGPCPVLIVDETSCYIPALFPLSENSYKPTSGIILWTRIGLASGLMRLKEAGLLNLREIRSRRGAEDQVEYGCLAGLLYLPDTAVGLFSMVELSGMPELSLPVITAVEDSLSPLPGLGKLHEEPPHDFAELADSLKTRGRFDEQESFTAFEQALTEARFTEAKELLQSNNENWKYFPKAHYATGCLYESLGDHGKAAGAFFEAQRLDHFAGEEKFLAARSREAKPFREKFPEVFDMIRRGERLRALTTLRNIAPRYPLLGNSILSYCLRGAKEPAEGLTAAEQSLALDRRQPDVLSNKWSFLFELGSDEEALEIAAEHCRLFPGDLLAIDNVIDSLLMTEQFDLAILYAFRYMIQSANPAQALRQFFKVYERIDLWTELHELFDTLMPLISGPTPETLVYYGEVLTENEYFSESITVFEQALTVEPGNSRVILGYARSLARAGKEEDAKALLQTVLADPNRIDNETDRTFLITLFAEILGRTGRREEALETFHRFFGDDVIEATSASGPLPALGYIDALLDLEERDRAREQAARLIQLWPEHPSVRELAEHFQLSQ